MSVWQRNRKGRVTFGDCIYKTIEDKEQWKRVGKAEQKLKNKYRLTDQSRCVLCALKAKVTFHQTGIVLQSNSQCQNFQESLLKCLKIVDTSRFPKFLELSEEKYFEDRKNYSFQNILPVDRNPKLTSKVLKIIQTTIF